MYHHEKKKQPITPQLIIENYQATHFKNFSVVACIGVLVTLILGYILARSIAPKGAGAIILVIACGILIVAVILLLTLGVYKHNLAKLQKGTYKIVTDNLVELVKGVHFGSPHHHRPSQLRFSVSGCYTVPFSLMKSSSTQEQEIYRYFHHAQIGEQFYLLLLNNQITQIYSAQEYEYSKEQ